MTPDRRLDQLEPLMADSLQKIDRLIEGQGQLVEFAVDLKADVSGVKADLSETKAIVSKVETTGEITANGLAKLTVVVDVLRDEMRERFDRNEQTQQEILTLLRERLK